MTNYGVSTAIILLVTVLVVCISACSPHRLGDLAQEDVDSSQALTADHASIMKGMDTTQVLAILGEPQNFQFDGVQEAWQYCHSGKLHHRYYTVSFVDGHVYETTGGGMKKADSYKPCPKCEKCFDEIAFSSIGELEEKMKKREDAERSMEMIKSAVLIEEIALFRAGSKIPRLINQATIDSLVEIVNSSPKDTYLLVGHTNSQGNARQNQRLSEDRAKATLDLLVNMHGLERNKMESVGAGEELPLHNNSTKIGRRKNSRVELRKR